MTGLLVAAIVSANCIPWVFYRFFDSSGEYGFHWIPAAALLYFALTYAQLHLFAIWTAFGGKQLSWRLSYLFACVALLTRIRISEPTQPAWDAVKDRVGFQFGYALCITFCLLLCRALGLHLSSNTEHGASASVLEVSTNAWQFRLRDWFWWVVGFGFLLALWQHVLTAEESVNWFRMWYMSIGFYLSGAALTISCLWLAFGSRRLPMRLAGVALALFSLCCWNYYEFMSDSYATHIMDRLASFVPTTAWLLGNLCLLRIAGCQLRWRLNS